MTGIALLLPMPLVLETGLEPVRPYGQRILSPLRLPLRHSSEMPAHYIKSQGVAPFDSFARPRTARAWSAKTPRPSAA